MLFKIMDTDRNNEIPPKFFEKICPSLGAIFKCDKKFTKIVGSIKNLKIFFKIPVTSRSYENTP